MTVPEIVLCDPVRTAIGTYGGSLKDIPAPALGAAVISETLRRSGLAADKVQTLVMGNVIHADVKSEAHALDQTRRLKRGIVTLCIGGGQGIALALEML
jgi:acetyl-CoA acetyltransferase